jgi:hypothetical protein
VDRPIGINLKYFIPFFAAADGDVDGDVDGDDCSSFLSVTSLFAIIVNLSNNRIVLICT